jgi:putative membrane protein
MKRISYGLAVAAVTLAGGAACAAGGATQVASTSALSGDRAWLAAVHQANLAEVQAGEQAEKKGGTAAVRAAGAMLVTDHVASDAQVNRVATRLKLTLPSSALPADAAVVSRLADETGVQFDLDFVAAMTTGHLKLIGATRTELAQGSVPQIKTLAQSTLPVLREHLSALRRAAAAG